VGTRRHASGVADTLPAGAAQLDGVQLAPLRAIRGPSQMRLFLLSPPNLQLRKQGVTGEASPGSLAGACGERGSDDGCGDRWNALGARFAGAEDGVVPAGGQGAAGAGVQDVRPRGSSGWTVLTASGSVSRVLHTSNSTGRRGASVDTIRVVCPRRSPHSPTQNRAQGSLFRVSHRDGQIHS
jgi:hypothetical protein